MGNTEIIILLVAVVVFGGGWVLLKTFRVMCRTVLEEGSSSLPKQSPPTGGASS